MIPVDVGPAVAALDGLEWPSGGPGIYAMIGAPAGFPLAGILDQALKADERPGMTLLSRVVPGQAIPMHTDGHDNHCRRRIHVPLLTNQHCWFFTGDERTHMRVGCVYEIDPTRPHGVANLGDSDRIHLIFNVLKE